MIADSSRHRILHFGKEYRPSPSVIHSYKSSREEGSAGLKIQITKKRREHEVPPRSLKSKSRGDRI
jgi:hypothetical protein